MFIAQIAENTHLLCEGKYYKVIVNAMRIIFASEQVCPLVN